MKEKNDLVAKDFVTYPDVAADIINVLVYQGEPVVKSEQLLSAATETLYQGKEGLRNQLEDVAKYEMTDGTVNALYLFANQTGPDRGMLLRKASYTGGAYREQYEGKTSGIYPVMELVLYWGRRHWNGSRSMKGIFCGKKLRKEAWRYIDDLHLHVWEMRYLPKETRERFTSDMRIVVDYLAEGKGYRSEKKVIHKESLVKMLRVLSGDENVEDTAAILKQMNVKEEDEITMCELFDQYIRKGRKEGVQEGIRILISSYKEIGVSFEETISKVKEKYSLEEVEAQENMSLYW